MGLNGPARPSARLRQAIVQGDVEAVTVLAPVDSHLDDVDPTTNMTPLMLAIEHQQRAIAEVLLAAGADVNQALRDGWTALHHAVDAEADGQNQTGKPAGLAIVEILLQAGADPRAVHRAPTGDLTAGELARRYGWIEAAERLGG